MNEYSRTELLIGEEGLGRLKQATVMVFGVGGVGSHCIEALARSGAGRLILIDNDKVSLTNINRQSIAYHSTNRTDEDGSDAGADPGYQSGDCCKDL